MTCPFIKGECTADCGMYNELHKQCSILTIAKNLSSIDIWISNIRNELSDLVRKS